MDGMVKRGGLISGLLVLCIALLVPCPFEGLSREGWIAAGLMVLMAIWWVTEVVPLAITSLIPIIVAPLAGIVSIKDLTASYAHPLIFLFMGGFILSLAMERTNLHRRIARRAMIAAGPKPAFQVGGMMAVTAFLSMWMSNTATSVMMLPIALSVIGLLSEGADDGGKRLGTAMLLGIAYSASIGGMATLIGTPPNALMAAYLSDVYQIKIGFGEWMILGVPFSLVLLGFTWWWLTRRGLPATNGGAARELLKQQLRQMGSMSRSEKVVLSVFVMAASGWIFRKPLADWTGLPLTDTGIAMMAALIFFFLPGENTDKDSGEKGSRQRLLTWEHAQKLPWGILVLFGGGLALASVIEDSGLAGWIGGQVQQLVHLDGILVIAIVTLGVVFLTEFTSNTATAAGLLPLVGPAAVALGMAPTDLAVPAALAASCAFMMPVATPPNAVVFGSGVLEIKDMVRAGLLINLVSVVAIVVFCRYLLPYVIGS